MKTAFYIDGLNLYYGALRGSADKWLNLESFCRRLLPHDDIVAIKYFTALVRPRLDDPQATSRQETYLRAVATLPTVSVHRGRFTSRVKSKALADSIVHPQDLFTPHFRPRGLFRLMWQDKVGRRVDGFTRARVVIEEEKGTDVNLAVHLVHDVARGRVDKAVVVSNDSDLAEAISLAKTFGVTVGLVNPHPKPTSRHLLDVADFVIPFRREVLSTSHLPSTLRDAKGREIHAPKRWR